MGITIVAGINLVVTSCSLLVLLHGECPSPFAQKNFTFGGICTAAAVFSGSPGGFHFHLSAGGDGRTGVSGDGVFPASIDFIEYAGLYSYLLFSASSFVRCACRVLRFSRILDFRRACRIIKPSRMPMKTSPTPAPADMYAMVERGSW